MQSTPLFAALTEHIANGDGRSLSEAPSVGCTLKRGSLVVKAGVEYRIASIAKTGVVKLNNLHGGFAMYSHVNACKQLELSL